MKGPVHQKPKDRPRKQRIRTWLKQVARENSVRTIALGLFLADYFQDGQIDMFGLLG